MRAGRPVAAFTDAEAAAHWLSQHMDDVDQVFVVAQPGDAELVEAPEAFVQRVQGAATNGSARPARRPPKERHL